MDEVKLAVPRTVFVCVRERGGKGASCAGRGSRVLLTEARSALEAEGIGPDELAIRACGCLGLCKQGTVMLLAAGEAALTKKPRKPGKKSASEVYTRVEPDELREILREALIKPA